MTAVCRPAGFPGAAIAVQRRTICFSGRVQGVGFRYTTCAIAAGLPVTGYVRNLPDGRVELVAEAEEAVLDQFLEQIGQQMGSYIRSREQTISAARGEFEAFQIRH